jgi:hypothetical protein
LDFGYNREDILIQLKAAMSYRDCYKNLFLTLMDWSNWLGPKAMWVDSCEFHSDEDLLAFSYNPLGWYKDSGDVSMLMHKSYIRHRSAGKVNTNVRRPAHGTANFYRDCLVLEDSLLLDIS